MFFGNTVVSILETLKILSRTCYCVIAEKNGYYTGEKMALLSYLILKMQGGRRGYWILTCNSKRFYLPNH